MDELIYTLKQQIIEALNLEDMTPEDIDENASLFGEGLGLDSIDALELIVLMEKNYGIKLKDPSQGKEIFKSVAVMADFNDVLISFPLLSLLICLNRPHRHINGF